MNVLVISPSLFHYLKRGFITDYLILASGDGEDIGIEGWKNISCLIHELHQLINLSDINPRPVLSAKVIIITRCILIMQHVLALMMPWLRNPLLHK